MDSTFQWMSRYTNYCVSVVQTDDAANVLRAFGSDPDQSIEGGARQAADLYQKSAEHWPVVRVVRIGGWCVAIEMVSFEALRAPVLARLSAVSRTAVVGVDHLPERRMAYAEKGAVWGPFRAPTRTSQQWPLLEQVAERAGASLAGWVDDKLSRSSIEFLSQVVGTPIDDVIMDAPGVVGAVLPLLPTSFDLQSPVRSDVEARLVALVDSATDEQLCPAVARQVHAMLVEATVESEEIANAVAAYGNGEQADHIDDSPVGNALRVLLAEHWLIVAAPLQGAGRRRARGPQIDTEAIRRRVSAGSAVAALLRSGPQSAVAEMLHRRSGADWQADLVSNLEGIEVASSTAADATARLSEYETRRDRSIPIPPSLLKTREEADDQAQKFPR